MTLKPNSSSSSSNRRYDINISTVLYTPHAHKAVHTRIILTLAHHYDTNTTHCKVVWAGSGEDHFPTEGTGTKIALIALTPGGLFLGGSAGLFPIVWFETRVVFVSFFPHVGLRLQLSSTHSLHYFFLSFSLTDTSTTLVVSFFVFYF